MGKRNNIKICCTIIWYFNEEHPNKEAEQKKQKRIEENEKLSKQSNINSQ